MTLLERLSRRLRDESGFGLIELLAAMLMLNIGILALVAAFTSGQVSLRRAGKVATAATLADRQMELYRSVKYDLIKLDQTSVTSGVDDLYRCDAIYGGDCEPFDADPDPADPYQEVVTRTDCTGSPLPNECLPTRAATGADGKSYRIDTYIVEQIPTGGRAVRRVTIVVRDGSTLQELARQTSDFDQSTG